MVGLEIICKEIKGVDKIALQTISAANEDELSVKMGCKKKEKRLCLMTEANGHSGTDSDN